MFASILVILSILAIGWAKDNNEKPTEKSDVEIIYLRVQSTIQARFATTIITSQLANKASSSNMVTFTAQLPDSAFMSNFSMQIDDKTYYGTVKEKEEAEAEFEKAKAKGESTGLVAKAPRETNTFTISVNVEARSKVVFNVTYQELLKRVHGVYKHIINLQTEQPVSELKVDVYVTEKGEIKGLKVPKFGEKAGEKTNKELLQAPTEPNVQIKELVKEKHVNSYHIHFEPKSNGELYNGQLVVLYDVKRDHTGGEVQVVNGYFVHFFAPEGLKKRPKGIVFVLDKSGSMQGRKMTQLKEAMKVILNDLGSGDNFQILFFSDSVETWRNEMAKATSENVKAAIRYVEDMEFIGGTNIYDALQAGLKIFKNWRSPSVPMILFLTDGQPTVGETSLENIINDTTTSNTHQKVIIHGIAFGEDAEYDLLKKISSRNRGLAKRVYEDSDAALQLEGFYAQVSSPLLTELKIVYLNESVDASTIVQDTHSYYDGDEVVVVGKVKEGAPSKSGNDTKPVRAKIVGQGASGAVAMETHSSTPIICPVYEYSVWYDGGIAVEPKIRPDIWCCPPPYCCWGTECSSPPGPTPTLPPKEPLPARTVGGFLERVWAYQTIKKLLKDMDLKDNSSERDEAKKKALDMSLKYNFVTELTSMVVVKPDGNKSDLRPSDEKDEGKRVDQPGGSSACERGLGRPDKWITSILLITLCSRISAY